MRVAVPHGTPSDCRLRLFSRCSKSGVGAVLPAKIGTKLRTALGNN